MAVGDFDGDGDPISRRSTASTTFHSYFAAIRG
jgi:hypothetical protein